MKKLFTILIIITLTTSFSFAQKGTFALGVGSTVDNQMWVEYSLKPTVGYFITDNMMIGTGFSMASSTWEEEWISGSDIEYETAGMEISPFFRIYMNDALFASASVAIGSSSYKEDASYGGIVNTTENTASTFGLNVSVGYSLMWNDRVCFEPMFGIATASGSSSSRSNYDGTVTESDTDDPSLFGMAMGLGINIRLGGE